MVSPLHMCDAEERSISAFRNHVLSGSLDASFVSAVFAASLESSYTGRGRFSSRTVLGGTATASGEESGAWIIERRHRRDGGGASWGRSGGYFWKKAALISLNSAHCSGRSSSKKIASTGQTSAQTPQSMHSSGLM